ncbi:MAG: VWA domain-containing protein [Actinomycetota bacterium]|nr:VWA domain-containing protein [Actinomycetota bacterium]MDH5224433.1 VWA domain-containing protein [Actinomycetota bacterium]MDH5312604.1 VWA domain-containing protein [Actinomycetota bacterium]
MVDRAAMGGGGGQGPLPPLIAFGRDLRARGLPVGTGRILTFVRAVAVLGLTDRDSLYWAGRTTMIARHDDLGPYEEAFDDWYRSLRTTDDLQVELNLPTAEPEGAQAEPGGLPQDLEAQVAGPASEWRAASEDDEVEPGDESSIRIVASAAEVLRSKSFNELTEEERAHVMALIRTLRLRVPVERTRRTRPASKGDRFDLRRTLRRSLRTQGEPFDRAWRARTARRRPLVLILDISGSMAPYSRALMQFAYAAMAAGRRVETFVFGTRLTRVTRTLRTKDPDRAMHDIGRQVQDWEGGTRIGESLRALLEQWSQRAALRGAVVVLCSDGLERGDPELLKAQMFRLRRLAHRVIWVNPLKGSPRYEPLARGMAAALPSVDVFLSGHNLESLEHLATTLGG